MDLCLPDGWRNLPGAVFRDDLGACAAVASEVETPRHFVSGLCDWRTAPARLVVPRTKRPRMVRWCAPAWLLEGAPRQSSSQVVRPA